MFTDPFRTANWRAVESDFMQWVQQVEEGHLQSVKAGEAALGYKDHNILAAGNTLVVGNGGYNKVQDAVNAAPSGARTIIQINAGTYKYVYRSLSVLFQLKRLHSDMLVDRALRTGMNQRV